MSAARALLLLTALVLLAGCHEHDQFVHACNDVHHGMTRAEVEAQMAEVGGVYALVGETDTWQRESMLGNESCEVLFDSAGRVRVASYHDWSR